MPCHGVVRRQTIATCVLMTMVLALWILVVTVVVRFGTPFVVLKIHVLDCQGVDWLNDSMRIESGQNMLGRRHV